MRRGNCYVACEALYHLVGGRAAGWRPHTVRHEGDVHWYLVRSIELPGGLRAGVVVDPTVRQFRTPPPYARGRGRGFLTRRPSRRALELMRRMTWQEQSPKKRRSRARKP